MDSDIEKINILRLTEEGRESIEDIVVKEFPITIILNNDELVTMLCSPKNLDYLAVGFLFSEGLLESKDEIKNVLVDENRGIVRVNTKEEKDFDNEFLFKRMITSGCGRGASFYHAADAENREQIQSDTKISTGEVLTLMKEFQQKSEVFRETGGVHSAALCDTNNILVFMEDIGRHNAIDKIFGECVIEDIPTDDRVVVTSGRVSSEILLKVSRRNIPIIISKSAPTNLGIRLANELGMTLLGFARGKRVNAYTNDWRITD
ncbi:MAG: formate dehydrogenase accessory sulfurtransferase FdhD [Dehalococcoidales bacterium]|nr:MAG: formate dehydrogenase accessory sulfurtransferase FdhD [Dehalococcoidales bacterium]